MRRNLFVAVLTIGALMPAVAQAQYFSRAERGGVVSQSAAGRFGLKRAWFTQIQLDRSLGRVNHIRQHVSSSRFYTVYEVTSPEGSEYFREDEVDRFGDPLGVEGAEEKAKARVRELRDLNVEAEWKAHEIPEVTIYVQTDRATLQALDGATGRTKWVTTVGDSRHPSLAPGANDDYVAAVNGSYLYVLNQQTGKVLWSRQLEGAPGAGAALSSEYAFVPTVKGKMEVYNLEKHRKPPWYYQATGRLLVQPTISTNSVSWATDRGYLYVGHRELLGVRFRKEARESITARATFMPPNQLYFASVDGFVYCVHEFNGDTLWRFPVGDPIYQPPVVTRDGVFVVADSAGMYRVDPESGVEQWWTPKITKLLAVSKNRVYCMGRTGRLVIVDAKTGGRIDSMPVPNLDLLHTNWQTDRVYVGTTTGVVQCLHEIDAMWPTVHNIPDPEESQRPEVVQRKDDEKPPAEKPPADPFGGAADPFGGGGADPFGGGAGGGEDPFGGGGAGGGGGGEDPFGGGAGGGDDPFGGGAGGSEDPFGGGGGAAEGEDPFGGGGAGEDPFGG